MNAKQMWDAFPNKKESDTYEAWSYGAVADKLAELTLKGIKTATASAYPMYEYENEEIPCVGSYSIILDSQDQAVCIIQTTEVQVISFKDVDENQAYQEGEGDLSLMYWREVHEDFFKKELGSIDQDFNESMLVVCEKFKVVYPK